jgi:Arc/MetJ-type ribon-helix-helix transcriptional regulator
MRIKEVQVEIPEYLYEESIRLTTMGLFRDFSDLVRAGIRHELAEAKRLIESESAGWEEGLAKLRARIEAKRAQTGYKPKSKEEIIDELRAIRREIWEEEYPERYTGRFG